jgi:hypothetical protein
VNSVSILILTCLLSCGYCLHSGFFFLIYGSTGGTQGLAHACHVFCQVAAHQAA